MERRLISRLRRVSLGHRCFRSILDLATGADASHQACVLVQTGKALNVLLRRSKSQQPVVDFFNSDVAQFHWQPVIIVVTSCSSLSAQVAARNQTLLSACILRTWIMRIKVVMKTEQPVTYSNLLSQNLVFLFSCFNSVSGPFQGFGLFQFSSSQLWCFKAVSRSKHWIHHRHLWHRHCRNGFPSSPSRNVCFLRLN